MVNVFSTPPTDRYFEDYPVGAVFELGSVTITADEIVDFARKYDPQDMHVDPVAAAVGPTGGLIASGWHTVMLLMRLTVDNYLPKNGLASPGIDELRWTLPVRPGDRLRVRATITDARRSRSKPDRGIVHAFVEVLNQRDEVVLTMKPLNMIRCRTSGLASTA